VSQKKNFFGCPSKISEKQNKKAKGVIRQGQKGGGLRTLGGQNKPVNDEVCGGGSVVCERARGTQPGTGKKKKSRTV